MSFAFTDRYLVKCCNCDDFVFPQLEFGKTYIHIKCPQCGRVLLILIPKVEKI